MREIATVPELRQALHAARQTGATVGLVPTMGYLHEGHLRLADAARAENDVVVMSIYVNPTQFGPAEDFARYPRDLEQDRRLAEEHGVDILFTPDTDTMYPGGPEAQRIWVVPEELDRYLCGASRPGHFRGVCTVVAKLFNMVQPDRAYFGQKDAQQAVIVGRMILDLAFPIELRVIPTARAADGLALSSRNVYLSPEERQQAAALHTALDAARESITQGERNAQRLEALMRRIIEKQAPSGSIDYVNVVDLATLQPINGVIAADALLAVAVYFGGTRLIDNTIVRFTDGALTFS